MFGASGIEAWKNRSLRNFVSCSEIKDFERFFLRQKSGIFDRFPKVRKILWIFLNLNIK